MSASCRPCCECKVSSGLTSGCQQGARRLSTSCLSQKGGLAEAHPHSVGPVACLRHACVSFVDCRAAGSGGRPGAAVGRAASSQGRRCGRRSRGHCCGSRIRPGGERAADEASCSAPAIAGIPCTRMPGRMSIHKETGTITDSFSANVWYVKEQCGSLWAMLKSAVAPEL